MRSKLAAGLRGLHATEDGVGLAAFRVMFGVLLAVDAVRYLLAGWVHAYYIAPKVWFTYLGFGWVEPLPGPGMYAVFVGLLLAGLGMAVGWAYRGWAALAAVGHAYVFLLAPTNYLNHAYLLILLTALMTFMPAAHVLSVDAHLKPGPRPATIPRWPRVLLRAQIGIVYMFGGVAKLNPDWIAGHPVRGWLTHAASQVPLASDVIAAEWFTQVVIWGGIAFDLAIVPLLLWRRSRVAAVLASVAFHVTNAYVFNIGIFPWVMLAVTTLFLEPSWPRRLPGIGRWLPPAEQSAVEPADEGTRRRWVTAAIAVWLIVQIIVPLRSFGYPGDVAWTEEGHAFAWRMKLRSKSGVVTFRVTAPEIGARWVVDPSHELTPRQLAKMVGKPDLILQYAHHLAERFGAEYGVPVEVHADAWVSLNGRRRARMINPRVDLAAQEFSFAPASWILPRPP